VLTAAVTDSDDVVASLRDYDAARRPRTRLVRASAQVGRVAQWSNRGQRQP
jgi:hypothetical protein